MNEAAANPPSASRARPIWLDFALVVLVVVLAFLAFRYWLTSRAGFEFPPTADIASMEAEVRLDDEAEEVKFTVSKRHYEPILAALAPSNYDAFPAKWEVFGTLHITTADNRTVHVMLFNLSGDEAGAFAAGSTYDERIYYRGGNTARLRAALERAHVASR